MKGNLTDPQITSAVDLTEIISEIYKKKWLLLSFIVLFTGGGVFYALQLPNIYKSSALVLPVGDANSNPSSMKGLGGLAGLAGISLGEQSVSKTQMAIEIVKSRRFANDFIDKYDLLPKLMAVKGWNIQTRELNFEEEIYDPVNRRWKFDENSNMTLMPTMQQAYEVYKNIVSVKELGNGFVSVSALHQSPDLAKDIVGYLIEEVNKTIKSMDISEAENRIFYLESELKNAEVAEIKTMFYRLIEKHTETLTLANTREEYVFKTIDPALAPEKKEKPSRGVIVILAAVFGGLLGLIVIFIRYSSRR
ncbi:LPS O-antigen length regulator [Pseudoalteromonas phenolica]|uniref:LPS O-antigen length regulator n=1 Tax=Pseudoalteromonas phenolica TaxID=161398 RepID=A0A5R9PYV0_9GAMM|nr:Wzz/FepE/Etk N-terminal domain-containing protein [Pseudoalteromonas phenolica]TLX45307.1 LPS O-antigen length regulator [Pseudoalteromonas phenolica]